MLSKATLSHLPFLLCFANLVLCVNVPYDASSMQGSGPRDGSKLCCVASQGGHHGPLPLNVITQKDSGQGVHVNAGGNHLEEPPKTLQYSQSIEGPREKTSGHNSKKIRTIALEGETDLAARAPPSKPSQPRLKKQSYYAFNPKKKKWEAKVPAPKPAPPPGVTRLAVFSWNVDFTTPFPEARMQAALWHLQHLVSALPPSTAAVIFLQEMLTDDMELITLNPWVRQHFRLTDINGNMWQRFYGSVTLVDARLPIAGSFRVPFAQTNMGRDALIVDVLFGGRGKMIRLCNLHLESLIANPPIRPAQMAQVAQYLKQQDLAGALAAGDFNAIQDFDRTLHTDNQLRDAYLELGGVENSDAGYTWGMQTPRNRFPLSRMDKAYLYGGIWLLKFERFGRDVQLSDSAQVGEMRRLGFEKAWVTDHLGIMVEIAVQ